MSNLKILLLTNISIDLKKKCEICAQSKKLLKPFYTCMKNETNSLELVHSNVIIVMFKHMVIKIILLLSLMGSINIVMCI